MTLSAPILTTPEAVAAARAALRRRGQRLVLTNGVFDLLHTGHLRYLSAAAALGDALWVALNSDESVRRLKGPRRPLLPWAERAELLAALRPVAAVLYFDAPTADGVIRAVAPELYVKGGDYSLATLPEADSVRAIGAEAHFLPFVEGQSTTALIERIVARYG